jgi:hypothetical protein
MDKPDSNLDLALKTLQGCAGVETIKVLTTDEKKHFLELELKMGEKIAYGMCKVLNQGIIEALERDYTIAFVMDTSIFEYPHHPHIMMVFDDDLVGEQVDDLNKIEELKKDKRNFFLWDNFVVYTRKLPKGREARERLRIVYPSREASQLKGISGVFKSVFGTPSSEGDVLLKNFLSFSSTESVMGTGVIGFDLKE